MFYGRDNETFHEFAGGYTVKVLENVYVIWIRILLVVYNRPLNSQHFLGRTIYTNWLAMPELNFSIFLMPFFFSLFLMSALFLVD